MILANTICLEASEVSQLELHFILSRHSCMESSIQWVRMPCRVTQFRSILYHWMCTIRSRQPIRQLCNHTHTYTTFESESPFFHSFWSYFTPFFVFLYALLLLVALMNNIPIFQLESFDCWSFDDLESHCLLSSLHLTTIYSLIIFTHTHIHIVWSIVLSFYLPCLLFW